MQKAIRMKSPPELAGRVLCRYEGERNVLYLGGDEFLVFSPGDFIGYRVFLSGAFVEENPHMWEPCEEGIAGDNADRIHL